MSMFMPTATGGPANQQDGPQCDLQELNSFLPELAGLSVQTKRRLNKSISQEEGKKWSPRLPPPRPPKSGLPPIRGNAPLRRFHPARPPPSVTVFYVTRTHVLAARRSAQPDRPGRAAGRGQPGCGGVRGLPRPPGREARLRRRPPRPRPDSPPTALRFGGRGSPGDGGQ